MDSDTMSEELSVSLDSPLQRLTSSLDVGTVDAELAAALLAAKAPLTRYQALRAASDHGLAGPSLRAELPMIEAELRANVGTLVLLLRARAVTPERVLICLKTLLGEVSSPERDSEDAVRQQVIRWAIEDYFRGS